jgi:hypothetical protein
MKTKWFIMFCVLVLTVGLSAEKMSTKTLTQATGDLPVGIIVTYGGDLSIEANLQAIKDAGWLLCDGALYNSKDYPELFVAIGNSNGGDASGNFNVPDLRDRFIRGTNGKSNVDPDAASRIAAAKGGAVGNKFNHAYGLERQYLSNGALECSRPGGFSRRPSPYPEWV